MSDAPVPQRLGIVIPSSGAFDSRTRRISMGLAQRGHRVTVYARADAASPAGVSDVDGYRLIRTAAATPRSLPLPVRIVDRALATRRQTQRTLRADEGADLYQGTAFMGIPVALALGRRAHVPVVYDALDLYADARRLSRLPKPARALIRARERGWARAASAVVTVNDPLADILEQRFGIARPAVVLNCAPRWDAPAEPPRRFHEALGLPPETQIVLYHGGLEPERGIEELLAIAPRLPADAHVVLLGYGSLRDGLRAQIDGDPERRGRVHLLDAVAPGELLPWVASADVAVAAIQPTTLNHRLATPNKLFEALAAGVPVVASDFPAMRSILCNDPDHPLGAVCDPTDLDALLAATSGILALSPADLGALRSRCRAAAHDRYAWELQLDVLIGLYTRLTGRPW